MLGIMMIKAKINIMRKTEKKRQTNERREREFSKNKWLPNKEEKLKKDERVFRKKQWKIDNR